MEKQLAVVKKAFRVGVEGKPFVAVIDFQDSAVFTDTDGPCERYMQSIPFIEGLRDARSAYGTGRALLLIGSCMDMIGLEIAVAQKFIDFLTICIAKFYSNNPTIPWSGEATIEAFGTWPSALGSISLAEQNPDQWSSLRESLLRQVLGPRGEADCSYSHPSLAIICDEVVPRARSFHLDASQYEELEAARWYRLDFRMLPIDCSFVVHVDGEQWTTAIDDARLRVRTDYLYADFNPFGALVVERTSWATPDAKITGRIIGVDFDKTRPGMLTARCSENVLVAGKRVEFEVPKRETDRIFRVAAGFALLLQHPRVKTKPIGGNALLVDHSILEPLNGLSIDEAIEQVMSRDSSPA